MRAVARGRAVGAAVQHLDSAAAAVVESGALIASARPKSIRRGLGEGPLPRADSCMVDATQRTGAEIVVEVGRGRWCGVKSPRQSRKHAQRRQRPGPRGPAERRRSHSTASWRARATSSPGRPRCRSPRTPAALQPAVHLRWRGPRQNAFDARGRQPDSDATIRRRGWPTCIRSVSSATWCSGCGTTPSPSSSAPIVRSMRC